MKLDVLISTLGRDGIERVARMSLPEVEGVSYVVSWQMPEGELPPELRRPDLRVFTMEERGVSKNRNNAIEHSRADICLTSDDDLSYTPHQLLSVLQTFEERPDLDVAVFRFDGADGKIYPGTETDFKKIPKYYYVSEVEVAHRRGGRCASLRYDERFGRGAPVYQSGEGELFLYQARKMGLNCRFFPITITTHPRSSTGIRLSAEKGVLMATGAILRITKPMTAFLRIPLKAFRNWRSGDPFWRGLYYLAKGALTI